MSRYTGPSCRQCRRENVKLYLKGERCYTPKCAVERRKTGPGQHGLSRKKLSNFGIQLREKQKLKRIYGLSERQFKLTFLKAERMKGIAGENFISLLERRLDNVVFRLGLVSSRNQGRQIVSHGHIKVNGKKVDIPSYLTMPGEEIALKQRSLDIPIIKECLEKAKTRTTPRWLEIDLENAMGRVTGIPVREDFSDIEVNDKLIVEFYSR